MLHLKNKFDPKHFPQHHYEGFLAYCRNELGLYLEGYNSASVVRRLLKMMNEFRVSSLQELQTNLAGRPNPRAVFIQFFSVNVTELFREPNSLKFLRSKVMIHWRNRKEINIWMAGCSTGEEVLSLAILLAEENLLTKTNILATDINNKALQRARERSIDLDKLEAAKENYQVSGGQGSLLDYGIKTQNHFILNERLLDKVNLEEQDLFQAYPNQAFDLVWCKNVLIYFQSAFQYRIINHLSQPLKSNAFLILGEQESMAFAKANRQFRTLDYQTKVYQKLW